MGRLILGVIAGYLIMIGLVIAGDVVLEGTADYSFANLLLAFPYGFIGGWVAAKIAVDREVNAGLLTALLAAIMATYAYVRDPGQPLWYLIAITASLAAGSVVGAYRKFASLRASEPRKKKKNK